jgi:2-polyprenyl-3-methyl-5-hydroxy-6-metoxy-1,4-benzoquinol methylase
MYAVSFCPVCSGTNFSEFLRCKDFTVSHGTFRISKCQSCELLITTPRPADNELGNYYLSDNYVSHTNKSTSFLDRIYRVSRYFTLRWKFNLVQKYIPPNVSHFKLLDYGCGTGDFLNTSKQRGAIVAGYEPSPQARAIANQKTETEIYSQLNQINGTYQAITLWHVLEHIPDLNDILNKLQSHVEKNGIIFIAVPNPESNDANYFQENWAGYDVPRHLWHFSKTNMKLLLEKNDLQLIDIIPMKLDAFYVSILSTKYQQGKLTIAGFIKGLIAGLRSNMKAGKNNHSSLIYVARK